MITSAGVETYDEASYDPAKYPDVDFPTRRLSAEAVKRGLEGEKMKINRFEDLLKLSP